MLLRRRRAVSWSAYGRQTAKNLLETQKRTLLRALSCEPPPVPRPCVELRHSLALGRVRERNLGALAAVCCDTPQVSKALVSNPSSSVSVSTSWPPPVTTLPHLSYVAQISNDPVSPTIVDQPGAHVRIRCLLSSKTRLLAWNPFVQLHRPNSPLSFQHPRGLGLHDLCRTTRRLAPSPCNIADNASCWPRCRLRRLVEP